MRLLGVDFGFARIGLAVGDAEFRVFSARPALAASGTLKRDADAIDVVARREEANRIVVGLPLDDGAEGRMARICRTVGGHLEAKGWSVGYTDETLSSVEAEAALREVDFTASERRKRRDGEAACRILERYVDEQAAR